MGDKNRFAASKDKFKVSVIFRDSDRSYEYYNFISKKCMRFPTYNRVESDVKRIAYASAKIYENYLNDNRLETLIRISVQKRGLPSKFILQCKEADSLKHIYIYYTVTPFDRTSGAGVKRFSILKLGNDAAFKKACEFYKESYKLSDIDFNLLLGLKLSAEVITKVVNDMASKKNVTLFQRYKDHLKEIL